MLNIIKFSKNIPVALCFGRRLGGLRSKARKNVDFHQQGIRYLTVGGVAENITSKWVWQNRSWLKAKITIFGEKNYPKVLNDYRIDGIYKYSCFLGTVHALIPLTNRVLQQYYCYSHYNEKQCYCNKVHNTVFFYL